MNAKWQDCLYPNALLRENPQSNRGACQIDFPRHLAFTGLLRYKTDYPTSRIIEGVPMSIEGQCLELKSRDTASRKLSEVCVAFANARGGELRVGIEDGERLPPKDQKNLSSLSNKLCKEILNNTNNVSINPSIVEAENGGEYISLEVPRSTGVASTSGGKYFRREGDENRPVVGDEIMHLAADRANWPWETLTTAQIPRASVDTNKVDNLISKVKSSKNAKDSVKKKTTSQMLDHFKLAEGKFLTNLGILCIGKQEDRVKLGTAPIIQFIKKDEAGQKTNKIVWDEHDLSPIELVEDVWEKIPDFREIYEIPNGMHRDLFPAFEKEVVRELIVNALVHRPYTQKGDIFLNLSPDSLKVVNPGRLPIGVTPQNILQASMRRNDNLAKLFHDIGLMEREGSGIDLIYDILLSQGRPAPELTEGDDSVTVTLYRRLPNQKVMRLIASISESHKLSPYDRIILGMLAKNGPATARIIAGNLGLTSVGELKELMERLLQNGIVVRTGKTQATQYSVASGVMSVTESDEGSSTLNVIHEDDHVTLVENDISQHPRSSIGEIHSRIGNIIPHRKLRSVLARLVKSGRITSEGIKRGTRYLLNEKGGSKVNQGWADGELPLGRPPEES